MMKWTDGTIHDVDLQELRQFIDHRGWLSELFRTDDPEHLPKPEMGYLSVTHPSVSRGPHEHRDQTDRFAFFHGTYRVFLWDDRETSPTYGSRMVFNAGADHPLQVVIPPGVVHAYRNDGPSDAFVLNFPDALYAGKNKTDAVDEIRHEDMTDSPFRMDM